MTAGGAGLAVALAFGLAAPATACRVPADGPALARAALTEANRVRSARGLPALTEAGTLARAAQAHSCWMADRGRLSHDGAGGSDIADRARGAGYRFGWLAENVAAGQRGPGQLIAAWIDSAGHRRNLLDRRGADAGVGLALASDGTPFWTMMMGRRQ